MSSSFETDAFPGRPKILFVGLAESSHTHSWIDLLEGSEFNVRLFALPTGAPPAGWRVKTYVTAYGCPPPEDPSTRAHLFDGGRVRRLAQRGAARLAGRAWSAEGLAEEWLAKVVRRWRPDIVHTFGYDPAGEFYYPARLKHRLEGFGKWVLQTRGGSDLALRRFDPVRGPAIAEAMRACDQLLSDNLQNFRIAREMGVREDQLADIAPVPGAGGVDVDALAASWAGATSQRRLILWPKVYESQWSKALPVFEALRLCWEQIRPCEIHLLAMTPETRAWFWTLPEEIRESCRIADRLPRERVLELMTHARVMLAPSLVDGVPNSLYEAMAAGAFPILSPLETIRPVVEHGRNVLFAHNLYPEEIADALRRAMTDDALVDGASRENLALVRRVADRAEVRTRVIDFYERLAARRG